MEKVSNEHLFSTNYINNEMKGLSQQSTNLAGTPTKSKKALTLAQIQEKKEPEEIKSYFMDQRLLNFP